MKDNKNLRHITNLAKRQKLLKETLMMLICFVKITAMFSKIFTLVLLKSVHEEFSNVTYNKTAQLPTRSTVIIMYRRYMKPCHIFLNEVFSFFCSFCQGDTWYKGFLSQYEVKGSLDCTS